MWELRGFEKRRAELHKKFDPILHAKETTRLEREDITLQLVGELQKIDFEEGRFIDSRLYRKARRLDIELPPLSNTEMWQENVKPPIFTLKGRLAMRKAIDEEQTRRRDVAAWWWKTVIIPGLAAATGLVGALTGLFAVLHHK
jgi:hypothetical protein